MARRRNRNKQASKDMENKNEYEVETTEEQQTNVEGDDLGSSTIDKVEDASVEVSAESFVEQEEPEEKAPVAEALVQAEVPKANLPHPEGMGDLYNALQNYSLEMGATIAPSQKDLGAMQRRLNSMVMSQFRRADAVARISFLVSYIQNDESGAFGPAKLMRGIGHRDVIRKEEAAREWSVVIQAISSIASGKASMVSLDKLGDLCLPENREAVVSTLSQLTGADTE